MTALLLILAVFTLVLLNAFFVAAEFGLVRARREKLEQAAEEGGRAARGARMALHQLNNISEFLSACQLGITLTSIGIGFLGEVALASILEDALGGVLSHAIAAPVSFVVAYVLATSAHITVGEQVPKIYAITHPDTIARATARPLNWFRVALKPMILGLNAASNAMLRLLGVRADSAEFQEATRAEDLKMLIAQGVTGGTLDPGEAGMLRGVFHLHEQEARQVMTPIPAVVTVDVADTVSTGLQRCIESGHTRLVATEDENTDRVRGIVHNNSMVRLLMSQGPDAPIEPAVKDALIVPETKSLDDLLNDLQRERASMSVVVDEYGRTAGIVTVEDILEEIVGEIADETDPAGNVRRLANGDWYARGHVPITDLTDYGIDLESDSDAYNSVGGFVFGELGRLPKRGDMVRSNDYSLRVESVRENRIEAVRIRDHKPDERRSSSSGGNGGGSGSGEPAESVRDGG
jgi:CBS domain containing-hemolysin-like protein